MSKRAFGGSHSILLPVGASLDSCPLHTMGPPHSHGNQKVERRRRRRRGCFVFLFLGCSARQSLPSGLSPLFLHTRALPSACLISWPQFTIVRYRCFPRPICRCQKVNERTFLLHCGAAEIARRVWSGHLTHEAKGEKSFVWGLSLSPPSTCSFCGGFLLFWFFFAPSVTFSRTSLFPRALLIPF